MIEPIVKKIVPFRLRFVVFLSVLVLGGCSVFGRKSISPDEEIRMNRSLKLLQLQKVHRAADYALYYDGESSPEIPVRVNAGDNVGFFVASDGRLKAIAGKFKMDIDPKRNGAVWKRYDLQ